MSNQKYEQMGVAMTCRSYAEYESMFVLRQLSLQDGPVLDVAGGASSFVAEANARGIQAQAVDPLYDMNPESIYAHGLQEIAVSTEKLSRLESNFDWTYYGSLDNHKKLREQSLQKFIDDYRLQEGKGQYQSARLPQLPFDDGAFSLVLCSHFLFLYHDQFDYDFHRSAVEELLRVCRVGGQVRIYPLRSLQWVVYPHLDLLIVTLEKQGFNTKLVLTELPFIPGSSELLCISK
ncbi:Methyltransferase domain-containing protein [Paenibacillus sp. 1_12]|uniref:class I SAM-dependent methyltransferase n=1 Tax=Paenibacillus sp. 1_12 TaxID=1566278 RepID=UPI0008E58CB7|nr:methyltransferase domain-containing protein [Paenibacillus sp. 1_12]SFL26774.1 Methyltransferase domain-containing protein [Paenibacillus sp. 1_12]